MSTLYQIDRAIEQLIDTGFVFDEETGEIIADFSKLEEYEMAYSDKLRACGLWIKNKAALARAIREEEKALAKRRRALEAAVERMKAYVMDYVGSDGAEYPDVSLRTRRTSRVVVTDSDRVPPEYERVETTVTVDKAKVGKALRSGETVPGCTLVEGYSLQVK